VGEGKALLHVMGNAAYPAYRIQPKLYGEKSD